MKAKSLLLGLLALLMASNSYGFCVYNKTIGYDTNTNYPGVSNPAMKPTMIIFKAYKSGSMTDLVINQYGVVCELTDHREPNDASAVEIKWIKYYPRDSRSYRDNDVYNASICRTTVYNKGGYVVVKGDAQSGFSCETYRD